MQRKRLVSASALFSLVSLFAFAVTERAEATERIRHFQGKGEGVVTERVTPAHWVIDYVGTATHLGKFTRRENIFFTGPGTFEGKIVFVGAEGDELNADFVGHFTTANDAVASYTFTGGSGRFASATGTAEASASTPDFVHVSVTFEGSIDY